MSAEAVVTIGILALVGILVGGYVWRRMPKGKQAELVVEAGEPFALRAAPADGRIYKLWARYDIAWTGTRHGYGLSFDLQAEVGGKVVLDRPLGLGARTLDDPGDYIDPLRMFVSSHRGPDGYSEKATVVVCDLGLRGAASEIVVRGAIKPSKGTTVKGLSVFLAR